ncbi:MAG: hypothetical protein Q8M88_08190 [Phenylobacterium sp.]|uniref:hypothetical protein n=1 Tax=Phenylobacterium sp. TaxID=1871053 RepID=UPI002736D1C3|nr:hypothetical protein [Phenylobacterium sp.]MDP3174398.1 hypothetical protein [Phenylobacterium sp.]
MTLRHIPYATVRRIGEGAAVAEDGQARLEALAGDVRDRPGSTVAATRSEAPASRSSDRLGLAAGVIAALLLVAALTQNIQEPTGSPERAPQAAAEPIRAMAARVVDVAPPTPRPTPQTAQASVLAKSEPSASSPARLAAAAPLPIAVKPAGQAAQPAGAVIASAAPTRLARGPSFDCRSAASLAEDFVCLSPSLGAADRELAQAYRTAVRSGVPVSLLRLQQDQWRADLERAALDDPNALHDVYDVRIEELHELATQAASGEIER